MIKKINQHLKLPEVLNLYRVTKETKHSPLQGRFPSVYTYSGFVKYPYFGPFEYFLNTEHAVRFPTHVPNNIIYIPVNTAGKIDIDYAIQYPVCLENLELVGSYNIVTETLSGHQPEFLYNTLLTLNPQDIFYFQQEPGNLSTIIHSGLVNLLPSSKPFEEPFVYLGRDTNRKTSFFSSFNNSVCSTMGDFLVRVIGKKEIVEKIVIY